MTARLTMNDLRNAGHCAAGVRDFFQKYGLDLVRLVREGIPLTELDGIDDQNMREIIARIRAREGV